MSCKSSKHTCPSQKSLSPIIPIPEQLRPPQNQPALQQGQSQYQSLLKKRPCPQRPKQNQIYRKEQSNRNRGQNGLYSQQTNLTKKYNQNKDKQVLVNISPPKKEEFEIKVPYLNEFIKCFQSVLLREKNITVQLKKNEVCFSALKQEYDQISKDIWIAYRKIFTDYVLTYDLQIPRYGYSMSSDVFQQRFKQFQDRIRNHQIQCKNIQYHGEWKIFIEVYTDDLVRFRKICKEQQAKMYKPYFTLQINIKLKNLLSQQLEIIQDPNLVKQLIHKSNKSYNN